MPTCPICGSSEANPHFGGISCRACAAFFRRYYHSKKTKRQCTCATRQAKSHPCRECRVERCLAIGMQESNIQFYHEKTKKADKSSLMNMNFTNPCRIIPRGSAHISSSKASCSLPSYEKKRMELCGGNGTPWSIYELTGCVKKDGKTFWNIVCNLFPQVNDLKCYDKDSLLTNFVPKWCKLEPTIDQTRNRTKMKVKDPGPDPGPNTKMEDALVQFYKLADQNSLSRSDIVKTFGRFWAYYGRNVAAPIVSQNFDDKELLAIVLLLFFDNGYTNITEKCAEMCRDIRKVILRELRAYQRDISDDDDDAENRFLSTMEIPLMMQKAEKVFDEEMLVCEMHHVRIHEDFLEAIRRHNI